MSKAKISLHPLTEEKLPQGWRLIPIGDVIVESQYGMNESASSNGNTAIIGMKNIQDGIIETNSLTRVDIDDDEKKKYLLSSGDILINRTNSYDLVGKVGIFDSKQEAVFASYLVRLLADKKLVNEWYMNYWLNSYIAQKTLKRIATKAISQANINPTEFKKHCYIPLPSLSEQEQIILILKCWDKAILGTQTLIELKTKQKQWLMRNLLTGKKRVKGFSEPWNEYHLSELFINRIETGYDDLPLLSITRKEGVINRDDVNRKNTSSNDKSKYLRICEGDIGYNTMRMWQGVSSLSSIEGIVSPAYTICTPKKGVHGKFMSYLFKYPKTIHLFYRYSQGLTSDTWNLKFKHFQEIKVTMPNEDEQKAISNILELCDKELGILESQLKSIKKQKLGLMQKLLVGDITVAANKEVA